MKFTLILLVAIIATTQARFLFQQEWELWRDYHGKENIIYSYLKIGIELLLKKFVQLKY